MRLAVLCASAILGADAFMTTPTAMRPTLRATALSTPASFNGVSCVFLASFRQSSELILLAPRVEGPGVVYNIHSVWQVG